MTWPVPFQSRRISLHTGRVSRRDAQRQTATVSEVLARLARQPGLILADEVGMGKTFVALAVAASVGWADRGRRPVVVMVPGSLREKWPRDFEVFRTLCLRKSDQGLRGLRAATASSGLEFFKLLDDPPSRRPHIIFLVHGALYRGLQDPWTKLAILRKALQARQLRRQRRAFHRFAADVVRVASRHRDPRLFEQLLHQNPRRWRSILEDWGDDPGDEPVSEGLIQVLQAGKVNLRALRETLQGLPLRRSAHFKERVTAVRRELTRSLQAIWHAALAQAEFRSPLLILDEAHHLKNPATRLHSLFVEKEAGEEAKLLSGALASRFERMLFLTATPFQLGHYELLNVLRCFEGISWRKVRACMEREQFQRTVAELEKALDEAQVAAAHLDAKWALVTEEDVAATGANGDPDRWWANVVANPEDQPERVQVVWRAFHEARRRMREAEDRLRPWVIRHRRPRTLPESEIERRRTLPGAAILDGAESRAREAEGLPIREEALLPFLLAARSQAVLRRHWPWRARSAVARATFAEGLASSYEAFLETRRSRRDGHEVLDEDADLLSGPAGEDASLRWYLDRLARALPGPRAFGRHPKVYPTVRRTLQLWEEGEKVLVFCHFRATGRSLVRHISAALDSHIVKRSARELGVSAEEARRELENIGDRFDPGRPLYRSLRSLVRGILSQHGGLSAEEGERISEVIRRFVRTAPFLARYFPFGATDPNASFEDAVHRPDASGVSLVQKMGAFVEFLATRCTEDERAEFLEALDRLHTGVRYLEQPGDGPVGHQLRLLPNVRLVNAAVQYEDRRRVLLGFNSPFFPEVLVASSVLAEGVDLHLNCRFVVHHDLCWNPSTLEQRTGRVDRLGAKAETVSAPIFVYLPYVAATQDEKMYRVVRDRERWFQVLMGEKYTVDESATAKLEVRVPLPEAAARELAFRLGVWPGGIG